VLLDPPHDVTDGALIQLYRYFVAPGPPPQRVSRWVINQREAMARTWS
jgi:hypothetical protein